MSTNSPQEAHEEAPAVEDLQEPSTEKDPGEEPNAAKPADPEPDHEAVGIGVIDGPGPAPEAASDSDSDSDESETA